MCIYINLNALNHWPVHEIQKILDEYKKKGQSNERNKKVEEICNDMLNKLSHLYSVEK